jgi:hypothetical protein
MYEPSHIPQLANDIRRVSSKVSISSAKDIACSEINAQSHDVGDEILQYECDQDITIFLYVFEVSGREA